MLDAKGIELASLLLAGVRLASRQRANSGADSETRTRITRVAPRHLTLRTCPLKLVLPDRLELPWPGS
jgi:hypothetical protein